MDSPSPARSLEHESVLSVYDNLREGATPDDLATPMETRILFPYSEDDGDDGGFLFPYSEEEIRLLTTELGAASRDSSLWSSCEIILADSRLSDGPPGTEPPGGPEERASDALTADPPPLDRDRQDRQDRRDRRDQPPPDGEDPGPDEATPAGVRVPPPLPLADPVASALRSVLTGLQHQMGRQRDEYEARISRYDGPPVDNALLGTGVTRMMNEWPSYAAQTHANTHGYRHTLHRHTHCPESRHTHCHCTDTHTLTRQAAQHRLHIHCPDTHCTALTGTDQTHTTQQRPTLHEHTLTAPHTLPRHTLQIHA